LPGVTHFCVEFKKAIESFRVRNDSFVFIGIRNKFGGLH
jgi:hypothetical protein